eukprot:EG_transcript_18794
MSTLKCFPTSSLAFLHLLFLSTLFCAGAVQHFDVVPPEQSWITDLGGYLNSDTIQQLNFIISDIKKELGYELGLALLPEMHPKGMGIEEFTQRVFNRWGIGARDKSNGILMLLSIEDRLMRIQTGAGSRMALSDAKCQDIIEEMKPFLRQEDYGGGCVYGFQLIKDVLRGEDRLSDSGIEQHLWIPAVAVLAGFLFYRHRSHVTRRRHFEHRLQRLSSPEFAAKLRYESPICAVCLEELPSDKKDDTSLPLGCVLLLCGHVFHADCIISWLAETDCCPVCRRSNPTSADTPEDSPPSIRPEPEPVPSRLETLYLLQVALFDDVAGEYQLQCHG